MLVEGVKDYAIFMIDPQGQVVTWNAGAEQIKGYRAEEIIGQHISKFYTPEDIAEGKPERAMRTAEAEGSCVDDLLAFSRLGSTPLHKERVSMGELARECLDRLRDEQEGRRITITVSELPDAEGDRAMLREAVLNLVSNALKFTQRRAEPVIQIGCVPGSRPPTYYVKDNGAGFDMQYADKLFGVFQRLHRSEDYPGTGVGLAIVERIITRHGGRVWAEAEVDKGATFFFTLSGPETASADHTGPERIGVSSGGRRRTGEAESLGRGA
jgi:PAS domain S-box-containing protein